MNRLLPSGGFIYDTLNPSKIRIYLTLQSITDLQADHYATLLISRLSFLFFFNSILLSVP